jgi:hypothetical protein
LPPRPSPDQRQGRAVQPHLVSRVGRCPPSTPTPSAPPPWSAGCTGTTSTGPTPPSAASHPSPASTPSQLLQLDGGYGCATAQDSAGSTVWSTPLPCVHDHSGWKSLTQVRLMDGCEPCQGVAVKPDGSLKESHSGLPDARPPIAALELVGRQPEDSSEHASRSRTQPGRNLSSGQTRALVQRPGSGKLLGWPSGTDGPVRGEQRSATRQLLPVPRSTAPSPWQPMAVSYCAQRPRLPSVLRADKIRSPQLGL